MNERELIALLKKKDREAFKKMVDSWQDMVYNTSLGLLQNAEDAEDTAQEVFIQVYESISSFKEESRLSTWLYRITVSKSLDHIRRKKRKKRFAFIQSIYGTDSNIKDAPDFIHPGVKLENKENAGVLFRAIERLSDNQKTAFVLNKIEKLGYQEIGDIMGLSQSAVDALLQRAKKSLQKRLETYYATWNE